MKLLLPFLCFSIICATPQQEPNYLLKKNHFGNFHVGMLLDSALSVGNRYFVVEKDSIGLEGNNFLVYNVMLDKEILFQIEPDCAENCTVYRYFVHSDKFKTAEGLGVGSKVKDVLDSYELEEYLYGEGAIFFTVKDLDYSFRIDEGSIPEEWWSTMNFDELLKNSGIDMIILSQ